MKKQKRNDIPADPQAIFRLLGLATRAGRAVSGSEAVGNALRRQEACLVIVAADSSENTKGKFIPPDRPPVIPVMVFGSKAEIGQWTGHDERAVAAILDRGFADRMQALKRAVDHPPGSDEPTN